MDYNPFDACNVFFVTVGYSLVGLGSLVLAFAVYIFVRLHYAVASTAADDPSLSEAGWTDDVDSELLEVARGLARGGVDDVDAEAGARGYGSSSSEAGGALTGMRSVKGGRSRPRPAGHGRTIPGSRGRAGRSASRSPVADDSLHEDASASGEEEDVGGHALQVLTPRSNSAAS